MHAGLARLQALVAALERVVAPLLSLGVRLYVAQPFFVSAIVKASDWDKAVYLARYEYPVSWLDPVPSAVLGLAIELLGSVLLAFGLATRVAAISLIALSIVVHVSYVASDGTLFAIVLLVRYAVAGGGAFSLDRALIRGLAGSALPLADREVRIARAVTRYGAPLYTLVLRLWLAAALALAGASASGGIAYWIPVGSAPQLGPVVGGAAIGLLAAGLATRPAVLVLAALAANVPMSEMGAALHGYWIAAFALLVVHGAGPISVDAAIAALLARRARARTAAARPHVVIVGAGFGGLSCAIGLAASPVRLTLIDRQNHHLFQPLLYQVATAGLSAGDIATPVRGLFRDVEHARVLLGEVTGVDPMRRTVSVGAAQIDYDYLVLATGATHSYFGREEWAPYAPGLKRVDDGIDIRRRLLTAFERAEATADADERRSLLTFLVVGGGPTGVELAGAIAELSRFGMEQEFRRFDPATARVVLVQSGARLLPAFPQALSDAAKRSLESLGVDVRLGARVDAIDADGVAIAGERIRARTVLWAAGVVASPAGRWLAAECDAAGRVRVAADLSVPGSANVFAIGDTASVASADGAPVPGLAPAAKQAGAYVARVIGARVAREAEPAPFRYRHLGNLATIGRKSAVADFGFVQLSGTLAWWLWGVVHVGFLVGVRNRVSVMFDWFWSYLTYKSGTRLITGSSDAD